MNQSGDSLWFRAKYLLKQGVPLQRALSDVNVDIRIEADIEALLEMGHVQTSCSLMCLKQNIPIHLLFLKFMSFSVADIYFETFVTEP